jgi:hypothetical protein
MKIKGYIYKYTFPDGKIYIGQTKNLEQRKRQHIDPISGPANTGFWEAYQRFGKYDFEVLKELEYEDEDILSYYLSLWERGYIYQYKADDPDYGYNKTSFVATKNKKRTILLEKYTDVFYRILQKLMNVFFSMEHKVWETHEPLTDEEKVFVTGRYKDGNPFYLDSFDFDNLSNNRHLDEMEEFYLEEYLGSIRNMIEEDARMMADSYVKKNMDALLKEELDKTAIVQIDKDGNIVREFHSHTEICQAFNVARADNVRNVLNGKQKTAYGYYWKYKKDITTK